MCPCAAAVAAAGVAVVGGYRVAVGLGGAGKAVVRRVDVDFV